MNARETYVDTLVTRAEAAAGRALGGRTIVRADPDRIGRRVATSYPMPTGTIIECDPAQVGVVNQLLGAEVDSAVTTQRWIELSVSAGAEHLGSGNNRVLVGELVEPPEPPDGIIPIALDREDQGDVEALRRFADAVTEDDLDEADLDLDDLDPCIVGLFDGHEIVAYASGRPYDDVPELDDIGVLVHPAYRRRGLGARAVAEFVGERMAREPSRLMLYRCSVDNVGSNRVAEALGFELVHTIGASASPNERRCQALPLILAVAVSVGARHFRSSSPWP